MLSSLALATVLGFQDTTITFKSNFEPLGVVIERLSKETHIPMAAFGELKGYPVYINVKDVPVRDLLNKLGDISGGEWEKKDGNFYLTVDSGIRQAQARKGDADLIAAIEATISQKPPEHKKIDLEELGKKAQGNQQEAMKLVGEMFTQMFMADEGTMELLRVIGSKDLSSLVEGRRVVLSSTPTSMQGQMPLKATNAIKAFLKKSAAEMQNKKTKPEEEGFDFFAMMGGGNGLKNPELVSRVQTVQAVFQVSEHTTLNVEISAYTDDGKGVYHRMVQLPIVNPELTKPRVKGETKLDVAASARQYAQALDDGKRIDPFMSLITAGQSGMMSALAMFSSADGPFGNENVQSHAIPADIRALMQDPVKNEPMAFLLGPLLDIEAAKGKNVVALPSDDVISILAAQLIQKDGTVEGLLDDIDRSLTQKVTSDGTWEVMQASSPIELQSAFCKREALGALIKAGLGKGYVNLDDCSKFATAQGSARGSELLAMPLITAVFRTSDLGSATSLTHLGFDSLKLYATLTDFQKQALSQNRPVPMASLTAVQNDIISRMVYNGAVPPMKSNDEMAKAFDDDKAESGMGGMLGLGMAMMGPMMAAMGMGEMAMDNERTVLLPDGVPVAGSIRLKTMPVDGLMATDIGTGNSTITMPEMLGMMNSDIPGFGSMKRNYGSYKLAKQKNYILTFQLGKQAIFFTNLYDVWVDDSKTYTKDQLPKEMQERLKGPQLGQIGNGGGGNPPPPLR